jgi:hypothetical protein
MFQNKSKSKRKRLVIQKSQERSQQQKQQKLSTKEQLKSVLLKVQFNHQNHQFSQRRSNHAESLRMNKLSLKLNLMASQLQRSNGSVRISKSTTQRTSKFIHLEQNQSLLCVKLC